MGGGLGTLSTSLESSWFVLFVGIIRSSYLGLPFCLVVLLDPKGSSTLSSIFSCCNWFTSECILEDLGSIRSRGWARFLALSSSSSISIGVSSVSIGVCTLSSSGSRSELANSVFVSKNSRSPFAESSKTVTLGWVGLGWISHFSPSAKVNSDLLSSNLGFLRWNLLIAPKLVS